MKILISYRKLIAVTVLSALLLLVFSQTVSEISLQSSTEQKRCLEEALHRNIITCYAQNGFYPESLDYLLNHYPLSYDESRFVIHYRPVASNLMPDVTIIERTP